MSIQLSSVKSSPLKYQIPASAIFQRTVRALVVSPSLEVRQPLLRALNALSVDVIVCSTVAQAVEFLDHDTVDVVFCDEHLPDGRYCDLVRLDDSSAAHRRVVVTTRTGEWDLYFEAVGNGAFDVIRCPWHPTDVEMVILRALRESTSKGSAEPAPI